MYEKIIRSICIIDKAKRADLQKRIQRGIYQIAEKLNIQQYVCKIFFRDLKKADDDFNDIWEKIRRLAHYQSQWETPVPTHWIEMERTFEELSERGNPVIKYKDILEMVPSDFPSPKLFVKYMQASGLVVTLNQSTNDREDEIVIDPQWLIDAFLQVIDFDNCQETAYGAIREIQTGKLKMNITQEIWKASQFREKVPILLKFMENLGLISKPFDHDCDNERSFYYIPSLLEPALGEEQPTDIMKAWLDPTKRNISKTFILDYRGQGRKQVPFPHFDKLMAKFISKQSERSIVTFQRYFCVINESPVGFILCHGCSLIKITMFTVDNSKAGAEILRNGVKGLHLLQMVKDISEELAMKFSQRIPYDPIEGISCNPYPSIGDRAISYATVEKVKQTKEGNLNCCNSPYCQLVEGTDLSAWQGKYII